MKTAHILIIDDEEQLRKLLGRIITLEGFEVTDAADLKTAEKLLHKNNFDIVLCDVKLPDGSGIDFVTQIKSSPSHPEVILLTAYGNIPDGIRAMKNGAFDYIVKGDDNDRIIPLLHRALEKVQLQRKVEHLEAQVAKKYSFDSIIGSSKGIQQAITLAKKVAVTDTTVLLLGETGTGKEVFAQAIHAGSKRKSGPFVALNCSAFSKELLESELFGHKAGAFTGAVKDKKGLIEEAHRGTLFLDEIGEMHIDLQSKLLRVLETNEFIKVGDTHITHVDVRIIAATNRNLQQDVSEGRFREDLFYRLNVFTIPLPPLRERTEDIEALANFYIQQFAYKTGQKIKPLSASIVKRMEQQPWKGNIRELKNTIERAVILSESDELSPDLLFISTSSNDTPFSFELSEMEKRHIQKVLTHAHGNKTEAARLLGIGLTTLYRKIEEYKLEDK
jgi:two-component system, NtrC family, response regulator